MQTEYNPVDPATVEAAAKQLGAIHSFEVDLDDRDDATSGRDLVLDLMLTLGVMRLSGEAHPAAGGF